MTWVELSAQFQEIQRIGDATASWRYSPDESPCEDWTLRAESRALASAIEQACDTGGKLLTLVLTRTRVLPPRLLQRANSPQECWLSAIRNRGIHVYREPKSNWRVDQGQIDEVVTASITFCNYLAASPAARSVCKQAHAADAGQFEAA